MVLDELVPVPYLLPTTYVHLHKVSTLVDNCTLATLITLLVFALASDHFCDLHHGPQAGGTLLHVLPQLFQLRQDALGGQASSYWIFV